MLFLGKLLSETNTGTPEKCAEIQQGTCQFWFYGTRRWWEKRTYERLINWVSSPFRTSGKNIWFLWGNWTKVTLVYPEEAIICQEHIIGSIIGTIIGSISRVKKRNYFRNGHLKCHVYPRLYLHWSQSSTDKRIKEVHKLSTACSFVPSSIIFQSYFLFGCCAVATDKI